ncbi:unnamed protein product, partial [Lampetra planeri]
EDATQEEEEEGWRRRDGGGGVGVQEEVEEGAALRAKCSGEPPHAISVASSGHLQGLRLHRLVF